MATDTKKVKLMQGGSNVPAPAAATPAPSTPSASAAASAASSSSSASTTASGGKNLLDFLMREEKLDVGKGFRLFD
jgi:hypothetical protein